MNLKKIFFPYVFILFFHLNLHSTTPPSYLRHVRFTSQYGQDKWVLKTFNYKKEGFFVDIGAWDGELISNTYPMEKYFKWKGICIEANPFKYQSLILNRDSINVHACLDYANHEVDFRCDNGLFGGIIDIDTDNGGRPLESAENILRMTTKTLEQVLDENHAPPIIDFLSIDVEGAEYRILKNFPFHKYTFLSMIIERPSPKLNALLQEKGYVFVKNSHVDTYYVHPSIEGFDLIEKNPFEQINTTP